MTEITIFYEGNLSTRCVHTETGEEIFTDAPKDNEGEGKKFSPTDLVAVALGSCVLTLMGIAAKRMGLNLEGLRTNVKKTMTSSPVRRIGKIEVHVFCPEEVDKEKQEKLEKAAKGCPVHHSLHPDMIQEFVFHWGRK